MKTLWEKEKLLITSDFYFSHNVFYSRKYIVIVSQFVHVFAIISLFAAEQEKPKIGISGKGLKLSSANALDLDKAKNFVIF